MPLHNCKKLRQSNEESVQIFAERLLALAEEAYVGHGQTSNAAIEHQSVGFFVGLEHGYLKNENNEG